MAKWMMHLRMRPRKNFLLFLLYYLLVVLPHEEVGMWMAKTFDINQRSNYNFIFLGLGLSLLVGYMAVLLWNIRKKGNGTSILSYFIFTVILTILSFKLLIVVNSEVVHFPQYAVLAVLIFPFTLKYGETLGLCMLLGAMDEAYQYFYLAPMRTDYFDFNDVILDTIGAAFGLILLKSFSFPSPRSYFNKVLKSPFFISLSILTFFLAVSYLFGVFSIYPVENGDFSTYVLVRKPTHNFWSSIPPNVIYHIVKPIEGLGLLFLILLAYKNIYISNS